MTDQQPEVTEPGHDVNDGNPAQDAQPRALAVVDPYDVEVASTLRQRIAYARALSQSGILPRDYAGKPANLLVAGEMGKELGLSLIQAALMLNVVEGRPSLGATGVRAVIQGAGHKIGPAVLTYSKHGVPVEASVTGQRMVWDHEANRMVEDGDPVTITWNIARAHRAGLCSVKRDDDGEPREVVARSQYGKVLPWEAYTEDMLDARATTKLGRTLFADCTMGLSYERDELTDPAPLQVSSERVDQPQAQPSERAAAVLDQTKPARRTDLPDEYDPQADLAVAGVTWWNHAGAQVSRRSKVQLAADRLLRWTQDNPEQNDVPTPDRQVQPNDTEGPDADGAYPADVVPDDEAPATPEPNRSTEAGRPYAAAVPADPEPSDDEPEIPDPHDGNDPWVTDEPEVGEAPVDAEPVDQPADGSVPDDQPPADDGPDLGDETMPEATTDEWLQAIDEAAAVLGKTRLALMGRWVAVHRKKPEDATPAELEAFYDQLRPVLEAAQK